MHLFFFALTLLCLFPLFAHADTIYLKNGRQIQATNTVRKNGKVTFETAAGTMSVPESVVDHIVSGDVPIAPQKGSNSAAADLQMAPPYSDAADAASVLQSILRNGAIDERALAQIDAGAATGAAGAVFTNLNCPLRMPRIRSFSRSAINERSAGSSSTNRIWGVEPAIQGPIRGGANMLTHRANPGPNGSQPETDTAFVSIYSP